MSCEALFGYVLRVKQGTCLHLSYLLGRLCAADNVGQLIRITIDTLQILLGLPQPPLLPYPYALIKKYI